MSKIFPPPIYSIEPGSWAQVTVLKRWPEIARRVIAENQFTPAIVAKLSSLQKEILDGKIRYLEDAEAPDLSAWQTYTQPHLGKTWLEVPWFFGEHYFYRRVMEAVGYFKTKKDPFLHQKEQGLISTDGDIQAYAAFLAGNLERPDRRDQILLDSLYFSIWGNQADLSLWPAEAEVNPKHSTRAILEEHLLEDHSAQVIKTLKKAPDLPHRVDLMLDNAGFELVCDLGLADTILGHDFAADLILHVKAHPTYVSDVILGDVDHTVNYLCSSDSDEVSALGQRLEGYLGEGKLITRPDYFWNSPLPMWELTPELRSELGKSHLLISKGDANYRRLLGDREWDITLPFRQVVDFLPVPAAALRTLKAELAVGLDLAQIQLVYNRDPNWMVNGRWGVIQYAPGGRK
jgi:uncharacterized protein with ATP-grasp and redox domains